MNATYLLRDPSSVYSPALLFYPEVIRRNIQRSIEIAGGPHRLRPHVKTHKTREIARLWLDAGVTKHKCATVAEAEMLASCDTPDVLIAYPIVGPNCRRVAKLAAKYPATRFGVVFDHPEPLRELSSALEAMNQTIDGYLDINCGMNRTGIVPGDAAFDLYRRLADTSNIKPMGLHVYDGHNNQIAVQDRKKAVQEAVAPALQLRERLLRAGLPVERLILGGTPQFRIHAENDLTGVECSPGTLSLHDANYDSRYPELGISPAAVLLSRVISNPGGDRVTLDLGSKAVSPDQPAGRRCVLLNIGDYEPELQSEEHLVIRTTQVSNLPPGTVVYALPAHVCPTVALYRFAQIVEDGHVVDRWEIVARDRELTV